MGGGGGSGVTAQNEPVFEQVVEPVQAAGVQTGPGAEARTQARDPVEPWWLQSPPPWMLPDPMAARRRPAGGPWYPPGPPSQSPSQIDDWEDRVVMRLMELIGPIPCSRPGTP
jgi:hypothetical protein